MSAPAEKARAHAPAKVILAGEHAVVHGHPAVALPFPAIMAAGEARPASSGVTIRSDRYPDLAARLNLDGTEYAPTARPLQPVAEAVRGALEALTRLGGDLKPFELVLSSGIPAGAGLGSSAAIAVAAIRATFSFHGRTVPPSLLRMLATKAEAIAHGTSSGLDPTTVAAEGPIRFVRDHAPIDLEVQEPFGLVVADSGQSSGTGRMVAQVKAGIEADPARREALNTLGEVADLVAELLECGDIPALGRELSRAHDLLARLGVSTPRLDAMVRAACEAGAFGAKLSGAGGGGCAIALAPISQLGEVAQAMIEAGAVTAWPTQYLIERDAPR
ncbi:mevalonate kinase [bacterium]|nr:mevalonate kinase [bacterium]